MSRKLENSIPPATTFERKMPFVVAGAEHPSPET
jgi:hypothetical protein